MSAKFAPHLLPQEQKTLPVNIGVPWSYKFRFMFFTKSDHWRQILGIRLSSWNKNAEFSLERSRHKQRKCINWNQMWKSCWLYSLLLKELFQLNLCLKHHCEIEILQRSVRMPMKWRAMKMAKKVEEHICAASSQHSVSHISCPLLVFDW
jgi:hypothetical protein